MGGQGGLRRSKVCGSKLKEDEGLSELGWSPAWAASKGVGERLVRGPSRLNPRKEGGQINNTYQLFGTGCLDLQHPYIVSNVCLRRCCLAIRSASCSARTRTRSYACVASLACAPGRGSAGSARRHARVGRDRVFEDSLTVSMVRCVICCRSEAEVGAE